MDQSKTILNFQRRESNPDEIDRLMNIADRSYVETVRRNFHEQAAGAHLVKAVRALAHQGEFTPNAVLRSLVADYEHLARGYSLRNASSSTCDCNFAELFMFRGRCVSCGAGLSEDMRRWRKEVDDAGSTPA